MQLEVILQTVVTLYEIKEHLGQFYVQPFDLRVFVL